jgi:hypothetical protein
MSSVDLMNWLNQNALWYIPLHVATGTIAWGWWNFSIQQELYEEFKDVYEHYRCGINDMEKLLNFRVICFRYFLLFVFLITGPVALANVLFMGLSGKIKLKRGLKFT